MYIHFFWLIRFFTSRILSRHKLLLYSNFNIVQPDKILVLAPCPFF
jgi:hypothetical protein